MRVDYIKEISTLCKISLLFHVFQIIHNPPYMSAAGMDEKLAEYVKNRYLNSKNDLSTVCMERCFAFCNDIGYMTMINIPVWMFLSSYEKLRHHILEYYTYINMVHPGRGIFGSDFGSTAFVFTKKRINNYIASYRRLFDRTGEVSTVEERENAFFSGKGKYYIKQELFNNIPGSPSVYWASNNVFEAFSSKLLGECFFAGHGLLTGHDEDMIYFWYEIDYSKIGFSFNSVEEMHSTQMKYAPATKGGDFRKWYGNLLYVAKYDHETLEYMKKYPKFTRQNEDKYFHEGVSWNNITMRMFSPIYMPKGCIFNNKMPAVFTDDHDELLKLMGFMGSKVCDFFTWLINPSVSCSAGVVKKIPICSLSDWNVDIADKNISLSKLDWDSFEISWGFRRHPLVTNRKEYYSQLNADLNSRERSNSVIKIENQYNYWENVCLSRFDVLKNNEEKLNRLFIDIYGLQDELTPEVADKDVTVRKADFGRDIRSLLSYAIGCMFGRYSLDVEGLAFAGGEWDTGKYKTFIPDPNNCIPITDEEYFTDDIVGRFVEFVRMVYGAETLEENLDFIAKALGNKGNTSREVIRNYFLNDFYKDHLKIYQKRPIYWLFDSGKQNGFKALVYMHRWNADTVGNLRIEYLHKMQTLYEHEIETCQDMIDHGSGRDVAAATKRKEKLVKQLKECKDYDALVAHIAFSKINIDLDDGVKMNYRKVQTGADGKFCEILANSKDIMAKEK